MQIGCLRRKIRHFRNYSLLKPTPKPFFSLPKPISFHALLSCNGIVTIEYHWIMEQWSGGEHRYVTQIAPIRHHYWWNSTCWKGTNLLVKKIDWSFFLFVVKGSVFLNGRNYFLMKIKWHEKSWQLLKISHYLVEKKNVFQKGQNQ